MAVQSSSGNSSSKPNGRLAEMLAGPIATPLCVICVLLICGALYLCSSLLVPLVIAGLAYLTLRPITCALCKWGLPKAVASGVVILGLFAAIGLVGMLIFPPIQYWVRTAPQGISKIRDNLDTIREPLMVLDRAESQLAELSEEADAGEPTLNVSVRKPTLVDQTVLVNTTGKLVAFIGAIAVLTFFMLSTGDELLNRILHVLPSSKKRHDVLVLTGELQDAVGTYLSQITFINIGLGCVVALVMWLIGMPTPMLWGALAALFNFIPYVGALAATGLVFLAAVSSYDTLGRAALAALAFWSVTAVEGQFVTPTILGRTLRVGPLVVLVAVAFWGFLWGLPGVFIAVPLLIVQRQIFAQFEVTYPLAVILGEDPVEQVVNCQQIEGDKPIEAVAEV